MEVRRDALAFLFLPTDGRVQQDLLLFILHPLQLHLVTYDPPLVEYDEYHQTYGQYQHADGPEKEDRGDARLARRDL
jgi:hypothetical protein